MNGMRRPLFWVVGLLVTVLPMTAAERSFDFSHQPAGKAAGGFQGVRGGRRQTGGLAGGRVAMLPRCSLPSPTRRQSTRVPALTQLSKDLTDERYPVIYSEGNATGTSLTTRFRMVSGAAEQIAGVVFLLMDERNFCRPSRTWDQPRFYKFVDGQRTAPVGNDRLRRAAGTKSPSG